MDVSQKALAEGRRICVKTLGKKVFSKASSIIRDIQCMSIGLKPSFLYDYSLTSPENLKTLVDSLESAGIIAQSRKCVLTVNGELFICNLERLSDVLSNKNNRCFVNISSNLKIPATMNEEEILNNFYYQNKSLQLPYSGPNFIKSDSDTILTEEAVRSQTNIDCVLKAFSNLHKDAEKESKCTHIFELNLPKETNYTTIYGILLGYPVVYWYETQAEDLMKQNCLDMVPLKAYKLVGSVTQNDKETLHTAYSFSCPENLASEAEVYITNWESSLKALGGMRMFKKLNLTKEVVCFSNPAM